MYSRVDLKHIKSLVAFKHRLWQSRLLQRGNNTRRLSHCSILRKMWVGDIMGRAIREIELAFEFEGSGGESSRGKKRQEVSL